MEKLLNLVRSEKEGQLHYRFTMHQSFVMTSKLCLTFHTIMIMAEVCFVSPAFHLFHISLRSLIEFVVLKAL